MNSDKRPAPKRSARELAAAYASERRAAQADDRRARVLRRPSLGQILGYLAAAAVVSITALVVLLPTVEQQTPIDSQIIGGPVPIVIVGDDVHSVRAEFHMQPQGDETGGDATYPDGLIFVLSHLTSSSDPPIQKGDLFVAIPHSLMDDVDYRPSPVGRWSETCTAKVEEAEVSELPTPAMELATDHLVLKIAPGSGCLGDVAFEFEKLAPVTYQTTKYSVAFRLPPVAYFDRDSETNTSQSSEDSEVALSECLRTSVLQDSYQLRATEWLGAEAVPVVFPAYRTEAIYYGGTEARPVTWVAGPRPGASGIQAPCLSQGIGIDLDRPGASEAKTLDQVIAGFLLGLGSGLAVPGIEIFARWISWRRVLRE